VYIKEFLTSTKQSGVHKGVPDEYKAIVDLDNDVTYAIASNRYVVTKHEDLLDEVEGAIDATPGFNNYSKEVWLSPDGGRMKTSYIFKDIEYSIDNSNSDTVNPKIEVLNSYDLGWAKQVLFGAFRLVCSNGLVIGKVFASYKEKHYENSRESVKGLLMEGLDKFSEQTQLWKTWVDKVLTYNEYEKVMNNVGFTKKDREEIGNIIETSSDITMDAIRTKTLTYWVFYNILCQYITHKVSTETENKRVVLERQMRRFF